MFRIDSAIASEPPIAAYSFDENEGETAHDSAGNHDGTIHGSTWTTGGKYGSALEFDGVNDLVTIPDSNDLDFTEAFTLEAWVRFDERNNWAPILTKETSGGFMGYQLYSEGATEIPVGYVAEDDWENYTNIDGSKSLPLETWSHLALTSDGEDLKLYINGELDAEASSLLVQNSDGALQIGGNEVFEEYFEGKIDEIRLYDEVLGEGEIEEDRDTSLSPAPENVASPAIFGIPEETRTLKADPGTWEGAGPISIAYQWERCEVEGPACEPIIEADAKIYVPASEDVGSRLRIQITATNDFGTIEAQSSETSIIIKSKPWFDGSVVIKGNTTVDETLTVDISGLRGTKPLTTSYAWERCTEFCKAVSEAGSVYKLLSADAATQIRVKVSGENAQGDVTVRSSPTVYISPSETGGSPRLAKPPLLSGLPRVSEDLETTDGEWRGVASIATAIQWERCDEGKSREDILGATKPVYEVSEADEGMRLQTRITAENSKGESEVSSVMTPPILPEINTVFILKKAVPLEVALEGIAESEAMLVSLDYAGETNGIYINADLDTSKVLADISDKLDEEAAERPAQSFMLSGSVSKEALGKLGEEVDSRSEVPSLHARGPEAAENPELSSLDPEGFADGALLSAEMQTWTADDENVDFAGPLTYRQGNDRTLFTSFRWHPTLEEMLFDIYLSQSPLAMEFDVKEINHGNSDPIDEHLGICLPWEKNDFWIGSRHPTLIDTTIPEEAGLYWDSAAEDSCEEKDLTYGVYHPEYLNAGEKYDTAVYMDGKNRGETAVGDADSSEFTWTVQILGRHCDTNPFCVNIPFEDIEGVGTVLIAEGYEFDDEYEYLFDGYGPAKFPGCFEYYNPNYSTPKFKIAGAHPCIFTF